MNKIGDSSSKNQQLSKIKEPINFSSFFDWDGIILAIVEDIDGNFCIAIWKPHLKIWEPAREITLEDIGKPQYGGITLEQKKQIKNLMTQKWLDNGKL